MYTIKIIKYLTSYIVVYKYLAPMYIGDLLPSNLTTYKDCDKTFMI